MSLRHARRQFGKRLRAGEGAGEYRIKHYRERAFEFNAVLSFSQRGARLTELRLELEGDLRCQRLTNVMWKRYGQPYSEDLIAEHGEYDWRTLSGMLVSYESLDTRQGPTTCWKTYSLPSHYGPRYIHAS